MEGLAEGASSEAESVLASRGPDGRPSSEVEFILTPRGPDGRPSSEAEIVLAPRGPDGRPSSEAEISSSVSEALEGPNRGAGLWAKRVLGFPCLKRLRASEFEKDPARVLYYVLRVF